MAQGRQDLTKVLPPLNFGLVEMFHSIQGEGPHAGRNCIFVRLAGCPLRCQWCDTAYAWAFTERQAENLLYADGPVKKENEVIQIDGIDMFEALQKHNPFEHLVFTGGEPLLYAGALAEFCHHTLYGINLIEFETAGVIEPNKLLSLKNAWFNVSPKLESSGNPVQTRFKPKVLKQFVSISNACFKFVVSNMDDFAEIRVIRSQIGIPPHRVWIMPETFDGSTDPDWLRELAKITILSKYQFSHRLHALIWGSQRGV